MSLAERIEHLLRQHTPDEVYLEAARALEAADAHPFAINREDVAWIAAALAIATGVIRGGKTASGVVHKVVMSDGIGIGDRLG